MKDLREQFGKELFKSSLNLPELDGKPCKKCGKVPEVTKKIVFNKDVTIRDIEYHKDDQLVLTPDFDAKDIRAFKRVGKLVLDRSNRVDCDSGDKKEELETYDIDCWRQIASNS